MATPQVEADVVIFGGGAAGLWSLDHLTRAGLRVMLLESQALGAGQTVASQGIIHGGLKYTLDGNVGASARVIAGMPALWRQCLRGERDPNLGRTALRADWCALWRTSSIRSQLGMAGARAALQVRPSLLEMAERPLPLRESPGDVYRLDEPVIDPVSFIRDLSDRHRQRILRIEPVARIDFSIANGNVAEIVLRHPDTGSELLLKPSTVVLAAGAGNAGLRKRLGLDAATMQRRPLHMVMVRGELPVLNGHCTDGSRTRVTITSATDRAGRTVWQVGGQIAEDGVAMDADRLLRHARDELDAVIPGFDRFVGAEWSTYRVDRAESAAEGKRPSDVFAEREGNVITAWPTKLALAPRLAERVASLIAVPAMQGEIALPVGWPTPDVATAPWDAEARWIDGL